MADILTLNADEKDIWKVVQAVRQLAERFQPSEDTASGALQPANNLDDVDNAVTSFTNIKQAATTSATGVIQLFAGTDNAAVRSDGTSGATQNSALLIADTTGALSRVGNGGIPVQGTNTNDNAGVGVVGEVISSDIASGSAVSLSNGTGKDITFVDVTAGDWDFSGQLSFVPAATTTVSSLIGSISTTSNTVGNGGLAAPFNVLRLTFTAGQGQALPIATGRVLLASTTRFYLVGVASFAVDTMAAYGWVIFRRAR